MASKHCRAELRANTRRKPISPLNMSLLILYFTFFVHPLLCISVPFFSPASFFPLFFNSFAAPPNIWLLAFYHSIAPCLPHSRLLPKSFFHSLLLLIIFHSATPLSLCLSFFIYFVLKATGCTLVVH